MIDGRSIFFGGILMSIHRKGKLLTWLGLSAVMTLALPTLGWAQCGPFLSGISCGPRHQHCPPAFKYIYEPGPNIHWHCGCPHPICNPCDLPNWGYHETCWTPYPFPPNWSHCATLPPAAYVNLNPFGGQPLQGTPPIRTTPAPTAPMTLPPMQPTFPSDELPPPRQFN
jgi:hypothetical protein